MPRLARWWPRSRYRAFAGRLDFVREAKVPPVDALRDTRVPMTIAAHCNPGASPSASLLLAVDMACTLFHLIPEEALAGLTLQAVRELGLECATPEVGMCADIVVWDAESPAELACRIGFNPLARHLRGLPSGSHGDSQ